MQISYSWHSKLWLITALILVCSASWAEGRIVKWVDEKGVTHYGDSIPPQYAGRNSTELNRQGHAVKRNKTTNTQAKTLIEAETKLSIEQKRHDSALLATYTTEQEFDLARDRNLQTDQAAVEGLNQRMEAVKERMAASKNLADGFVQRKKPVSPNITQSLKEQQDEIGKVEAQIAEKQKIMEATRQRFETDKQRFIQLKLNPNAPPPAPAPSATMEAAKPVTTATMPVTAGTTAITPASTAPATPAVAAKPATTAVLAAEKPAAVAVTPPVPVAPVAKPTPVAAPKPPVAATPATPAASPAPVKKIKRIIAP